MNTIGKLITTRIVCQNTMNMALGEKGEAIRVRHSTAFRADDVRMDMGLVEEEIQKYEQTMAALASKRFTKQMAVQVLVKAIGDEEAFTKAFQDKGAVKAFEEQPNARPMGAILELFDGGAMGANLITADHTGWGLVNAATQYFDHVAGRGQDTRLQSAWFGENNRRKDRVVAEALVLV